MEMCSTFLIIREMKINTTMRYHVTPVRTAIINKNINKHRQGFRKKETLVYCGWECKVVQPL